MNQDETDDYFEDDPDEKPQLGEPSGPLRRRETLAKKAKAFTCIILLCLKPRKKPHLLFCQHHYECVPAVLRNALQVHYDPLAEDQSDYYKVCARGALKFAKKGIVLPPYIG